MPKQFLSRERNAAPQLDRRAAWMAIADRVGGTMTAGKRPAEDTVQLQHGSWTLTLYTHVIQSGTVAVMHTRVLAFFIGRNKLRLVVRRRAFFDSLTERLGIARTGLGGRQLAERYVVFGRPDSRVRALLGGGLADAIAAQESVQLEVTKAPRKRRRAVGPDAYQTQVLASGIVTDVDRLFGMFAVGCAAMDALERTGSAIAEHPH